MSRHRPTVQPLAWAGTCGDGGGGDHADPKGRRDVDNHGKLKTNTLGQFEQLAFDLVRHVIQGEVVKIRRPLSGTGQQPSRYTIQCTIDTMNNAASVAAYAIFLVFILGVHQAAHSELTDRFAVVESMYQPKTVMNGLLHSRYRQMITTDATDLAEILAGSFLVNVRHAHI